MENSQLQPAPCSISEKKEKIIQNKTTIINFKDKPYPLEIALTEANIIFSIQEKYNLYRYENVISFQAFKDLHKYFRLFDNLGEIYNDLIKSNIAIKNEEINQGKLTLLINVNINKNNHEINIILNKRELDKYKDMDIILSNYKEMKKELDELKQKYSINSNLFKESKWLNNNNQYLDLIKEGIRHQLNKNIVSTNLIYRCSKDGDDSSIFHSKCDGISNTLVIGESESNKIFGGFTSQSWSKKDETKLDNNAFLFQLNKMEINYVIKGKGGIFCKKSCGPTFGNQQFFNICFQDGGKSLQGSNREDIYDEDSCFENISKQKYNYEGNQTFKLKDFEVFQLYFN